MNENYRTQNETDAKGNPSDSLQSLVSAWSVMKLFYLSLTAMTVILPFKLFAYDGSRCQSMLDRRHGGPFALMSSSTSFLTSTGDCAAIGMREEREKYIAENLDSLMIDSARGAGEYLDALAAVSGCRDQVAVAAFKVAVRKNFKGVYFIDQPEASANKISRRIDALIFETSILRNSCLTTS